MDYGYYLVRHEDDGISILGPSNICQADHHWGRFGGDYMARSDGRTVEAFLSHYDEHKDPPGWTWDWEPAPHLEPLILYGNGRLTLMAFLYDQFLRRQEALEPELARTERRYIITWEIEIYADTPQAAISQAVELLQPQKPERWAYTATECATGKTITCDWAETDK